MAFVLVWFAAVLFASASPGAVRVVGQQPGFLSIDCGLDDQYSGYTEHTNGIFYVSDGPYIDTGENLKMAPEYASRWPRPYQTVRSFPSGVRNCYWLPTEAGGKYLVRVLATYGNHDGRNDSSSMQFDLYLGPDYWNTVYVSSNQVYEALFVARASWAPICLVNTDHGVPFLSFLELRKLADALYPPLTATHAMFMYNRLNMGGGLSRFPDDQYDRIWWSTASPQWNNQSTAVTIQQPDPSFVEPQPVLRTAVEPTGNGTTISYSWQGGTYSFIAFLHFADFQNTQGREFESYLNGDQVAQKPYSPSYLSAYTMSTNGWYRAIDGNYNITLVATATSLLPPMINAVEIYGLISIDSPTTFHKDFDAIMAIKLEYGVKKNWMGDPCFPNEYVWVGVKCSNTSDNTTRITSLDLSNSYLVGAVSANFTLLTALENLDLSYNDLSGPVPDSLISLPSLRVLNLSDNHLSGNSLCKNYTGSLVFRFESDEQMCNNMNRISRIRSSIFITSIVASVLVVASLFLAYFLLPARRKANVSINDHARNPQLKNDPRSGNSQGDHLNDSESRRFTYKELEKITDNFKQFIGRGGFGLVYYGRLDDGIEVAVKMRSESSLHGLDEFLAEVQSLTKVHHRNIVSLVGYCWENDHLALVYEYMSNGNLHEHMTGKIAVAGTLNWGRRVHIAHGAAQGLEYLHMGCSPPIIHRDVKSSNILLGQNLQAKIADLGLSRTYLSDTQTHISATAAGTPGYMDPDYYLSGRLTESSDVYSFGVVLLEVATGETPMVSGQGHIVQRVKQRIAAGDIGSLADPRLSGAYDVSSMWKVVDIAMMCTAESGDWRPTMADVAAQLKDSLALEEARENVCSVPVVLPACDCPAPMSMSGPLAR